MKLYQNAICGILVSSCTTCPNKKVARYKTATGFTSRYECQAITSYRLDYSVPGNKLSYHPPIDNAIIRNGAYLEDCPLPDALLGGGDAKPAIPAQAEILSTTPKSTPQGE